MKRAASAVCNESELWDSFRTGSEEAFTCIYETYVDTLFSYGCRLQADTDLVKDCLQDLFIKLWNHHTSLGPTTSIKYYLFRSLRREIALKVKQSNTVAAGNGLHEVELSSEQKWINHENEARDHNLLEAALQQLSERQREAIYLRFYQNLEFAEIASLLDVTPRAVYKLIYRAIDTLQKSYATSTSSSFIPMLHISYSDLQLGCVLAVITIGSFIFPL